MQRTDSVPRSRPRAGGDVMTWLGNSLATLLAAAAVAAGVIGVLVAFDRIGSSAQPFEDGVVWLSGGIILSLAAHVFRREHHVVRAGDVRSSAVAQSAGRAEERDGGRVRRDSTAATRDVKDVTGMTVVTTNEAREVGTVKDVLFDPAQLAVLALVVAPAGMKDGRMFVEREYVRGFGKDAVTIQSESNMQAFATKGREREFADAGVHLEGVRVTTDQGDDVGKVGKVLITNDCRIAGVEARGGVFGRRRRIHADDIVSIGQGRLIVSHVRER
ncbi:MAG: PRC-barrel domain-containing protein [Dehalococcoidia bacterium]